ncbi:uncharacterized protein [Dysidea avara]|uniref:uncharacterized protein n=1 Tax=Dysidea avara TaxID=196820 RepID=UPI00331C8BD5
MSTFDDLVRLKIEGFRWTYDRLSTYLQSLYPERSGFSVRSLQRFCNSKGIQRTSRLNTADLDEEVAVAVSKAGPTYGRKTITVFLASEGVRVSERRVGESLRRVNPIYNHAHRTSTARQVNPHRYHADYFEQKLHINQNEKLVMFGCTHICALDGYSSKIVGFVTLPVKNNYIIYSDLFIPILRQYGMWDQIRVDQGKEWVLLLFVQEWLSHFRSNTRKYPHCRSTSKQNHAVERIWVEVNSRINYPIKTVLVHMEQRDEINLTDDHVKYCVSWFVIRVTQAGTRYWCKHGTCTEYQV